MENPQLRHRIEEFPVEIYLHNDQPMTCPSCGARTEFVSDPENELEYHKCFCGKQFVVAIDASSLPDDFGNHRFTRIFSEYDRYGNPK